MSEIDASKVMELRKRTGSGLMACKKALAESAGDMDAAVEYLRKAGMASADKKADREARQGAIFAKVNDTAGVLLELNCETDFVARNEAFGALGETVLDKAIAGEEVSEEIIKEAIAKMGENIVLRPPVRYEGSGNFFYIHGGGRVGALVQGEGLTPEVGKDLAMQIAAQSPLYLTSAEVPAEAVEKEKAIFAEICKKEGKPEAAWPKIIEGRVNKWYGEICLLEQEHWKDGKKKVKDTLPAGASVTRFSRLELGQG